MLDLFSKLFLYGYHDAFITQINIEDHYIRINFEKGLYSLDKDGNEKDLTNPLCLIINIDKLTCFKAFDSFEITKMSKQETTLIDTNIFLNNIKNKYLCISNTYYSLFNSTILFDVSDDQNRYLIEIGNCTDLKFEQL